MVGVGLLYMMFSFIEGMLRVNAVSDRRVSEGLLTGSVPGPSHRKESMVVFVHSGDAAFELRWNHVGLRLTFVSL